MNLIGLTGLPRSGKDTVAARLVGRHGYTRFAFADPLKEAAARLLGRPLWQMKGEHGFDREAELPEWGFSTRWFLQVFGTECLRDQVRPDFWVQHMRNKIKLRPHARVVVTDVRFENEVDLIHEFGGLVARVERPGAVGSAHVSDIEVSSDMRLYNSGGLDELYKEADTLAWLNGDAHSKG